MTRALCHAPERPADFLQSALAGRRSIYALSWRYRRELAGDRTDTATNVWLRRFFCRWFVRPSGRRRLIRPAQTHQTEFPRRRATLRRRGPCPLFQSAREVLALRLVNRRTFNTGSRRSLLAATRLRLGPDAFLTADGAVHARPLKVPVWAWAIQAASAFGDAIRGGAGRHFGFGALRPQR